MRARCDVVNTHGRDVRWLHVRLDSAPRYYSEMDGSSLGPEVDSYKLRA